MAVASHGEDWTVAGKDYHNVTVGQVEADRVHITYDGGLGTIALADLSPDLQKRFGYDPAHAKEASQKREEDQKEAIQSYASVDSYRAQIQAKEQAENAKAALASNFKPSARLIGTVEQTLPGGCLVRVTYGEDLENGMKEQADRQLLQTIAYGPSGASMGGGHGGGGPAQHYQNQHYSEAQAFGSTSAQTSTVQLPLLPDGLYFLSGGNYAVSEQINVNVSHAAPFKAEDGNTYQHFRTN